MTRPKELLVQDTARNNAEWCATMSRSHGLAGEFGAQAWTAPARTPLYYPDAVTLVPSADRAELVALFRPALLDDPATFVLAGQSGAGRLVAGAVASRSDQVVGISNVFALDGGRDAAWPVVLDAAYELFPTLPVVGYEQGNDLAVAIRHGFEPVGPLRIWPHDL